MSGTGDGPGEDPLEDCPECGAPLVNGECIVKRCDGAAQSDAARGEQA